MSNIKPVNCGKTTLEFELKIKVLYEKLPVIEIDLTYRTFTWHFPWAETQMASDHRKLVGLIEFLKALLELWPIAERDVLQWTSEIGEGYFSSNRTRSLKFRCSTIGQLAEIGWKIRKVDHLEKVNYAASVAGGFQWHSHSGNWVFEDWRDFFLGVKVKRWKWDILISKKWTFPSSWYLHIVLAGIHQPVFSCKSNSLDRIMKSPQKSRGDPGESNIRQLLHPVGPSLGSWLFGWRVIQTQVLSLWCCTGGKIWLWKLVLEKLLGYLYSS